MYYKIATLKQLEEVGEPIPLHPYHIIHKIVVMLDYEYGADRDVDEDDGGYVVYADSKDEIDEAVKVMGLANKVPEMIEDLQGYTNTLYLKNNEYAVNFIAPTNSSRAAT